MRVSTEQIMSWLKMSDIDYKFLARLRYFSCERIGQCGSKWSLILSATYMGL